MSGSSNSPSDAVEVAAHLAAAMERAGCEYALGGAIALGFWSQPRGTVDVDITLFLPPEQPTGFVRLLQSVGCQLHADQAVQSLMQHGFCQVEFEGRRVDAFLPTMPFYELARQRRQQVLLGTQPIMIWDAETLCVFKMMFFRRKDLADIEQMLQLQHSLDRTWILNQITQIYGARDPRIAQWKELTSEPS